MAAVCTVLGAGRERPEVAPLQLRVGSGGDGGLQAALVGAAQAVDGGGGQLARGLELAKRSEIGKTRPA